MTCPNCRVEMTGLTLTGHLGRQVTIDLCHTCQAFWFDGLESLQLAPGSVRELFRTIGQRSATRAAPLSATAACPHCGLRLVPTSDQQRSTRFEYRRCPQRHGRLISFFNFLREKNFVRPLSEAQIAHLRRNLQMVHCSNCGAPIDLAAGTDCAHCGSPLSMVDVPGVDSLMASPQSTSAPAGGVDPALPLALDRARRDVNASFAAFEREPGWFDRVSEAGLVGAALSSISRWIQT
jgi:Zn-finger nucleic acid-binding protein